MSNIETQEVKSGKNPQTDSKIVQRYARLLEFSTNLASTLDIDILMQKIVEAARELTECEAASLLIYDKQDNHPLSGRNRFTRRGAW